MHADLVIFDLDGTLVDSVEDLCASLNHALAAGGFPLLTREQVREYVGDGAKNLVMRALPAEQRASAEAAAILNQTYRAFVRHYLDHLLDHTVLYPGVAATLAALDGNVVMCVLSNKAERASRQILEGLGAAVHFRLILGGDSFAARKPDPVGFLGIAARIGVAPDRTLVVGDSANDIAGGKLAGMMTCGVLYGLKPQEVIDSRPDIVLNAFDELLRHLPESATHPPISTS